MRKRRSLPRAVKLRSRQRVCAPHSHVGRKAMVSSSKPTRAESSTTRARRAPSSAGARWPRRAISVCLAKARTLVSSASDSNGDAFIARMRIGFSERDAGGPSLTAHLAARDGIDPVAARLRHRCSDRARCRRCSRRGVTAVESVRASRGHAGSRARGGVDMDLSALCSHSGNGGLSSCATNADASALRFSASHRLGRDGVDVWTTIDLIPRN